MFLWHPVEYLLQRGCSCIVWWWIDCLLTVSLHLSVCLSVCLFTDIIELLLLLLGRHGVIYWQFLFVGKRVDCWSVWRPTRWLQPAHTAWSSLTSDICMMLILLFCHFTEIIFCHLLINCMMHGHAQLFSFLFLPLSPLVQYVR